MTERPTTPVNRLVDAFCEVIERHAADVTPEETREALARVRRAVSLVQRARSTFARGAVRVPFTGEA